MLLRCRDKSLDLAQPLVMGVLNITPDSFSDGGRYLDAGVAIAHGRQLIEEGAAIIDVGGESTRPGAAPVSAAEEMQRIVPVIEGLADAEAVISVDTSKPEVIRAAVRAGAGLINDVRALREPEALEAVVEAQCAVCLMHMQGEPRTMQQAPRYRDVVQEVRQYLATRVADAERAGIARERIVADPGFGFGKNLEHNLSLLRAFSELGALGVALLAGLSRKAMLGRITGREVGDRVHASVAAALIAAQNGAHIVRVHDVAATRDALAIWSAVKGDG